MPVTASQIKAIAGPGARADLVAAIVRGWPTAVHKAGLTTKLRACHFLAQIMTETGGLQILSESGAYRWQTILKIFGEHSISAQYGGRGHSARIGLSEAKKIAALPIAQRGPVLFNRVYGVGNPKKMREFNNTGPNDGWLYRGGGMMQCTGKSNYAEMQKKTGLPLVEHPELLHQPDSAFMAAYLEWAQDGRCNRAADRDDVVTVRKIINGGTNGLAECKKFLAKAKSNLSNYDESETFESVSLVPPVEDTEEVQIASTGDTFPVKNRPTVSADQEIDDVVPTRTIAFDPNAKETILDVQEKLLGMGYHEVGKPDGAFGPNTAKAIAAYKFDKKIDGSPIIDEALMTAVNESVAKKECRLVPLDRATITAKELAPTNTIVQQSFLQKFWAKITGVGALIVAAFQAVADQFHVTKEYIEPYMSWFSDIPGWLWFVGIAGVALLVVLSSNRIEESIVQAKRTNRLN